MTSTDPATRPNRAGRQTRELLLRTALRLFAAHGIEAVTLGDINTGAEQRNNSAAQYHFGGKEQLLGEIVRVHGARLARRRAALVGELCATPDPTLRDVMRALVQPLAEAAADDEHGGDDFVLLYAALLARPGFDLIPADAPDTPQWRDWLRLLRDSGGQHPPETRRTRGRLVATLVIHGLADWIRRRNGGADVPSFERFCEDLVDAAAGCYSA